MMVPHAKIGNGSKTLVILPGLSVKLVSPLAAAIGAQYQAFLDADYTIYVLDYTTNAPEDYSVPAMARDAATCLAELGVERADVVGASLGGMTALRLAADHPEMVHHLMICSSCAHINDTLRSVVETWIERARAKQATELATSFGQFVYSEAVWAASRKAILAAHSHITDEEFERFVRIATPILRYDNRDCLNTITAKTLVIGAMGDHVVTAEGTRELADLLGCERHMYDASFGHAVYDEAPDYVGRLLTFCQRA